MIAGCIERMRNDDCGACERRDACASLFSGLFNFDRRSSLRRPAHQRGSSGPRNRFLSFLGEVARRIEQPRSVAQPLRQEVERHLEPLLASGEIGIEAVARHLGLSRQTLYRRLKAEGVTFDALLDGLRRRLALRFVRKQGMPVKEAAWRLGFSDPAAFSRAFKRWTGTSPGAARAKNDRHRSRAGSV